MWFAGGIAENTGPERQGFAFLFGDHAAEIAKHFHGSHDLRTGLGAQRVTGLGGKQAGDVLGMLGYSPSQRQKPLAPFAGGENTPGGKRPSCRVYRLIYVLGAAPSNLRERASTGRVFDRQLFSARWSAPLAVNKATGQAPRWQDGIAVSREYVHDRHHLADRSSQECGAEKQCCRQHFHSQCETQHQFSPALMKY